MNTPNEALKILAKILINVEYFVTDQAEQLANLQEQSSAGKNFYLDSKIENQSVRLVNWINKHEELQNQFAELLNYLEQTEGYVKEVNNSITQVLFRYKDLEAINKDAVYWKKRAEYFEKTRKLIFDQLIKLQDGQKDKLN
jgi:hypothetical protein